MLSYNGDWTRQIIDIAMTVELALIFNAGKNKQSVVRRCLNKLKYRSDYSQEIRDILNGWSKMNNSYDRYLIFMADVFRSLHDYEGSNIIFDEKYGAVKVPSR